MKVSHQTIRRRLTCVLPTDLRITFKCLLSQEGNDTFAAEKLCTLADLYEANLNPDGRYTALTVMSEDPQQSLQAYLLGNQTKAFENS